MSKDMLETIKWSSRGPGKRFYGRKLVIRSPSEIRSLSRVLSSSTRLSILKYLSYKGTASISEIARVLNMSISNIYIQAKMLEKAGLIVIDNSSYKKKLSLRINRIILIL